ncbi:MAG: retron St85 family effector protein [Methylophilaceae bacterium]|nr:retron St85 family effector protein [Methylophilaceae bacterium]
MLPKVKICASQVKPYEGFILLCGGPYEEVSSTNRPISIRDAIQKVLLSNNKLRFAEEYKNWAQNSTYSDVILFEKHLAELSSTIVLVLESPGSLTELGFFFAIEKFRKKLLVIVDDSHHESDSFINLGPIAFLKKENNESLFYKWRKQAQSCCCFGLNHRCCCFDPKAVATIQDELKKDIQRRTQELTPARTFNPEEWLDVALLTCDLIGLYSALTVRQLTEILKSLGCKFNESEITQLLFVLKQVSFITEKAKGDQRFYISKTAKEFLELKITKEPTNTSLDRNRFRVEVLNIYKEKDKKRWNAIQEVRGTL